MRLDTISKNLSLRLSQSQDPASLFEDVFWRCAAQIDPKDFDLLDDPELAKQLASCMLPLEGNGFTSLSDRLDEKYFNAEDENDLEISGRYFALARLMASLGFYYRSQSTEDLGDAIYEAIMSTPNPNETVTYFDAGSNV